VSEVVGGNHLAELSYQECINLLRTEEVGRLAVVVGHYPQVFCVNYRLDHTIVVFRTHLGTKLLAANHANVGFEVDHLDRDTRSGWSVLIQGMAEDVTDFGPSAQNERTRGLPIEPWAGGDKPRYVRLIPAQITGRRIQPHELSWPTNDLGYL